jgi:hypothetical protein
MVANIVKDYPVSPACRKNISLSQASGEKTNWLAGLRR